MLAKRKLSEGAEVEEGKRPRQTAAERERAIEETVAAVAEGRTGESESQLRLDNLLEDVVLHIISYLNPKEQVPLAMTNRRMRQLTSDPSLYCFKYMRLVNFDQLIEIKAGATEVFYIQSGRGQEDSYESLYQFLEIVFGRGGSRSVGTLHLMYWWGKAMHYIYLAFRYHRLQLRAFIAKNCSGYQLRCLLRSQKSLEGLSLLNCHYPLPIDIPRGIQFAYLQSSFAPQIEAAAELPGIRILFLEGFQTEGWIREQAGRLGLTAATTSDQEGLILKARDFAAAELAWLKCMGTYFFKEYGLTDLRLV